MNNSGRKEGRTSGEGKNDKGEIQSKCYTRGTKRHGEKVSLASMEDYSHGVNGTREENEATSPPSKVGPPDPP